MKKGTPQHPKTAALRDRLKVPHLLAVGILECLWHWTALYARRGDVGKFTDKAIATGIGWDGDASDLVSALIETGWLDTHPDHRLIVHDWHEHAEDAVNMALSRAGEKFASGKAPKLNRLTAKEKKIAREKLRGNEVKKPEAVCAQPVHTECAHGANALPSPPLPSPPKPSLALKDTLPSEESSEPAPPASLAEPTFPVFDCIRGRKSSHNLWLLTDAVMADFKATFPGVDVDRQCRAAWQWVRCNPSKRKTAGGMPEFLRRWLANEQNRSHFGGRSPPAQPTQADRAMQKIREFNSRTST